jgi:hypothetical protein
LFDVFEDADDGVLRQIVSKARFDPLTDRTSIREVLPRQRFNQRREATASCVNVRPSTGIIVSYAAERSDSSQRFAAVLRDDRGLECVSPCRSHCVFKRRQ